MSRRESKDLDAIEFVSVNAWAGSFRNFTVSRNKEREVYSKSRSQSKGMLKTASSAGGFRASRSKSMTFRRSFVDARRPSYGFSGIPGIARAKSEILALEYRRPVLKYEPTFQLDSMHPFKHEMVEKILSATVMLYFSDHKYHAAESPSLAMKISVEIMRNVKDMDYQRYRIISLVTIGQKRSQCYTNGVCMLWDPERDQYANFVAENNTCFIHATAFGIYLD